jgi:hypothetical protein
VAPGDLWSFDIGSLEFARTAIYIVVKAKLSLGRPYDRPHHCVAGQQPIGVVEFLG